MQSRKLLGRDLSEPSTAERKTCSGGREPLERDAEAELEGAALERVGRIRVRLDAGLPEEPGRRGQEGGRDMERRRLAVVPAARLGYGVAQHVRRLWR